MTKRIALAAALLLTLGTAAGAGSFFYGSEQSAGETVQITLPSDLEPAAQQVTPEMIAMWKATAGSIDSEGTKAPI